MMYCTTLRTVNSGIRACWRASKSAVLIPTTILDTTHVCYSSLVLYLSPALIYSDKIFSKNAKTVQESRLCDASLVARSRNRILHHQPLSQPRGEAMLTFSCTCIIVLELRVKEKTDQFSESVNYRFKKIKVLPC